MSLHPTDGEFIDLETASTATALYRAQPNATKFKAQFFGKENIQQIFDENPECVGIRIYNSIDVTGAQGFILVGATADQNDLFDNLLLASGPRCPTCCADSSPLNE